MDVSLLKERFKAIKQETVDVAVSSINAYRGFIGNGVAVGKLAEPIFAKLLNAPDEGFYAFHFAFTGKNPPFDVMLYRAKTEIPKGRFTEIEFKKLAKHSRFVFCQNGSPVFHVKYGKNQANPYQRGLWVDDLSKLTILRRGNFRETNFGEFILEGAFRIHASAHKA